MKTPDDIPDGTECFHVGDDSERLRNLLAVLHRDGGHHVAAVGVEQACVDATKIFYDGLDAVLSAEHTRDELTRVTLERDALRAIVEGRTTPPTWQEIERHHESGGSWIFSAGGVADVSERASVTHRWADDHRDLPGMGGCRWWPLDTHGRLCAWPVVTR